MWLPDFLNFRSTLGDLEQKFRLHYFKADINQASLALSVAALFILAMTALDFMFFPGSATYYLMLAIRAGFGFFTLLIIHATRSSKSVAFFERTILTWGLVLTSLTLYIESTRPPDYSQSAILFVLIALIGYVMIPVHPAPRMIPPILLSIGYFWILFTLKDIPGPSWLGATVISFVLMHMAGITTSVWSFNARRGQFLAQHELQIANAKLTLLATTDDLTGIHNRRYFLERANEEFARFKRHAHPCAIMIADLDLLKRINDQYGHDAGDLAIRLFTAMVTREKRVTDIFGRLGGEEFGLLMPDTDLEQAKVVVDRIFAQRALLTIQIGTAQVRIAFTAGVAEALPHYQIFDDMLRAADRALYRGKSRGRDRFELADLEMQHVQS